MNSIGQSESYAAMMDEYSRMAAVYDAKWSAYLEATTRETIKRLNLRPADRLLDVGCGTGALLERLTAIHSPAQMVGLDPTPQMLALARQKLPGVALLEGFAERLPFQAEEFDVVVSCSVFHYIQDPAAALREMRRVLRRGGRLVITDWCGDYLTCRMCGLYQRLVNRSHYKIYRVHELSRLFDEAGFAVAAVDQYKINWLWGLMTARGVKNGN
jgi:ubiquinone/menaquinone biosynthesis C-methylase UbiE